MTVFDETYRKALEDIMTLGIPEINKRTGHETRALPGLTFSHDIEKDGFPLLTLRKVPIKMWVAEQVWFISGARKPDDFLREYTKIWDDFTNPGDTVTVAYGYRWRKHFGRDQLGKLVELLEKDPSSRHGVVITWDPASDGLGDVMRKNIPCPYTFTVNIIGGRLHFHNIIRSNDFILGGPSDIAGFAFLQCILAQKIGVSPGIYTHSISNAHVYDIHYQGAGEIIKRRNNHAPLQLHLPKNAFHRAEAKDRTLVEQIVEDISSQYHPDEAITGLKIVL
ncbi:MAG: thymidylate synthase [Patescibacteria group bacterium]